MEIGKRLSPGYIFFGLYIFAFLVYLFIGLQPAEATNYIISTKLIIPEINLNSDVTILKAENRELKTPDTIVGSYSISDNKTLLIGHSSTVFSHLDQVNLGDEIVFDEKDYIVKDSEVVKKEDIIMSQLLRSSKIDTLVIMTCAGEDLGMGDATHRLIITAEEI